jgi:hypothetical protein
MNTQPAPAPTLAVAKKKQIFIAEIKPKSPFGFQSPFNFIQLMEMAIEHGDWISVHVDALWGGDYNSLSLRRASTVLTTTFDGHSTTALTTSWLLTVSMTTSLDSTTSCWSTISTTKSSCGAETPQSRSSTIVVTSTPGEPGKRTTMQTTGRVPRGCVKQATSPTPVTFNQMQTPSSSEPISQFSSRHVAGCINLGKLAARLAG